MKIYSKITQMAIDKQSRPFTVIIPQPDNRVKSHLCNVLREGNNEITIRK